jgi:hypothetical protein
MKVSICGYFTRRVIIAHVANKAHGRARKDLPRRLTDGALADAARAPELNPCWHVVQYAGGSDSRPDSPMSTEHAVQLGSGSDDMALAAAVDRLGSDHPDFGSEEGHDGGEMNSEGNASASQESSSGQTSRSLPTYTASERPERSGEPRPASLPPLRQRTQRPGLSVAALLRTFEEQP